MPKPGLIVGFKKAAWRGVKALLICQASLMIGMAMLCAFFSGIVALYSALLAGICCILSTAVFAAIVFGKSGAQAARLIARSFYRAEAAKWLITAILMMLIFTFIPIAAASFFATFCVMQLSYWAAPGLFKN